jgi:hypothetical protein
VPVTAVLAFMSLQYAKTSVVLMSMSLSLIKMSVIVTFVRLKPSKMTVVLCSESIETATKPATYAKGGIPALKIITLDSGFRLDDPNARWGDPCYLLEPGDPGYVAPHPPTPQPHKKKGRKNVASNPTPININELMASGEDMYDGLFRHAVAINIKKNDAPGFRLKLDALIQAQVSLKAAQGAEPAAYSAMRTADSNGKGFIGAAVKVISLQFGSKWTDEWLATGLPDNKPGIPGTQDKRFAALAGLKGFFTANPALEVSTPKLTVTAALAETLYQALSDARMLVGNALALSADKLMLRDAALEVLRGAYRSTVEEIGELLADDDARWYDFGLVRPIDGDQPGIPMNVVVTVMGGGKLLVQCAGARRGNSFNFYRKIIGTDAEPVKVENQPGTTYVIEGMPVGATVEVTVTAVNDTGEGHASTPISVVVT